MKPGINFEVPYVYKLKNFSHSVTIILCLAMYLYKMSVPNMNNL